MAGSRARLVVGHGTLALAVMILGCVSVLLAVSLVGAAPGLLTGGASTEEPRIDHGLPIPNVVAGQTGWCSYSGPSLASGGACTPAAQSLPTASAGAQPGTCGFQPLHIAGLTAQWGRVVTALPARNAHVPGSALLSCASTWYSMNGGVLLAAILLDARNPNGPAPTPRGLTALRGTPELFMTPGAARTLLMRRIGNAWLVVEGGTQSIRLVLIRVLRAHARQSIHS